MLLTAVDGSSVEKDTVTAIVGASAALAGLVLVFLGVLVTSYQTLLGTAKDETLGRFRNASWIALGVFGLALVNVGLGVAWIDATGGDRLYAAVVGLFFAELGALGVAALYATWRVLLRG